ncbi:hypothetical protein FRX31_012476 [Thalictrum thalictroides]|uniref:Uncharacterized protein n=1 Tax=Thalictrum thalictroides TaxID=46969 RepID=A0A7J6WMX0_THATH|nr:hypothetical protein FRX31_012476 [Thalictrum thalictroides]
MVDENNQQAEEIVPMIAVLGGNTKSHSVGDDTIHFQLSEVDDILVTIVFGVKFGHCSSNFFRDSLPKVDWGGSSLEREVAEVLLQLQTLTPSFSSPFLITTWRFKGRRSAINVEPSPSPPSSPLHHSSPPPPSVLPVLAPCSNKVKQPPSPNSPLLFPNSGIDYQSKNPLEPPKKKIKITKEETSILLSVPPPPPTMQTTLNPKPPLSFFLRGDNNINNIVQKKPQSSTTGGVSTPSSLSKEAADKLSKSSNNVNKKILISLSPGQQTHLKQVSNNNPVVPTELTLGPTTPSPPQQKSSYLQPLINNNINHQTAIVGPPVCNYPKCLKAISIINTHATPEDKTIRMSYNPSITTSTRTPAVSEQTRKRKFEESASHFFLHCSLVLQLWYGLLASEEETLMLLYTVDSMTEWLLVWPVKVGNALTVKVWGYLPYAVGLDYMEI